MTTSALAIAAVLAPILAALLAYIGVSRRLSGRIATSEASSLWEESASIRLDYRERLAGAEKRMAEVEARLAQEEKANTKLERENLKLAEKNAECDQTIQHMHERLERLESENRLLQETIVAIATETKEVPRG